MNEPKNVKYKVNQKVLEFFEQLVNEGKSARLELSGRHLDAEITIHDVDNLRDTLKALRELGVHELVKGSFEGQTQQYARGTNKDKSLRVWVFPTQDTFNGCRIIEYEEEITVPATPATEAIPEHKETVKRKKIQCDEPNGGEL
jgi:hypothetical protein